MSPLAQILQNKPYLAWYVKNPTALSEESMLEHILNYGNWEDFKAAQQAVGNSYLESLFLNLTSKKRCNLRPETTNYFKSYFAKHA